MKKTKIHIIEFRGSLDQIWVDYRAALESKHWKAIKVETYPTTESSMLSFMAGNRNAPMVMRVEFQELTLREIAEGMEDQR
jgi:hypothetical protein